MVVRVERDTRTTLIHTVIAAARQDVDGVVAGLYELGLIDPDVDRGRSDDAARALMRIAFIAEPKPRQIQRIVNRYSLRSTGGRSRCRVSSSISAARRRWWRASVCGTIPRSTACSSPRPSSPA